VHGNVQGKAAAHRVPDQMTPSDPEVVPQMLKVPLARLQRVRLRSIDLRFPVPAQVGQDPPPACRHALDDFAPALLGLGEAVQEGDGRTGPTVLEGEANVAILAAVAKWLRVPRSRVRLVRGGRNRIKVVQVDTNVTDDSAPGVISVGLTRGISLTVFQNR